jgi:hypothetical protein
MPASRAWTPEPRSSRRAGTGPAAAVPSVRRTPVVTIILTSYLMIVLDISIVITALQRIRDGLGFSATGRS